MKDRIKVRIILFLLGICILTLGVALTIQADYGAGAWDSVNVGLYQTFGLSVGTFSILLSFVFVFIGGLLRKGKFKPLTIITAILLGVCTDGWLYFIRNVLTSSNEIVRIYCMVFGIAILSIGLGVYLYANLIPNSLDDCMMAFHERFNIGIGISKVGTDLIGVLIALSLGATINIGTILSVIIVGPLANYIYTLLCEWKYI